MKKQYNLLHLIVLFFQSFEQKEAQFHFVLSPANYVTNPGWLNMKGE
jgi:hypothetical protein